MHAFLARVPHQLQRPSKLSSSESDSSARRKHVTRSLEACDGSSPNSQAKPWLSRCDSRHIHQRTVAAWSSSAPDVSHISWPPPEGPGDFDYDDLSKEEVEERIEEAAEYICIMDDLRPLKQEGFNPFYEIWRRIARIPPEHRVRLLEELEPGAIRSLWKNSMSRYVLDEERSLELFGDYNVFCDFPTEPGVVYTYEGRCERFIYRPPANPFDIDTQLQRKQPRAIPWLKPAPGAWDFPQEAFRMSFFMSPASKHLHCLTSIKWHGPFYRWWLPVYSRVDVGLVLTPLQADAGADMVMVYPEKGQSAVLGKGEVPVGWWPAPKGGVWSPFSLGAKDYVRVAGPGVYVGCAYRSLAPGEMLEDNFVYFIIVRVE